jgi:hypothetical protein
MKLSALCRFGALLALSASAAFAQSPAASIAGKTCRGTFQVQDAASGHGLGAFQLRFGGTTDHPTAHVWRGFGSSVWSQVNQEVNGGTLSDDLSGFDDLGEAKNVQLQGDQVSLTTRQGASITLIYNNISSSIYDGTGLISTAAAGEPAGRFDWRGASAHILCR